MRKASKSQARTFFAPWLATLLVALGLVVLSGSTASAVDDVYICHATGNTQNLSSVEDVKGFVVNSPSASGDVSGHVGAGHQDGWDIIPPGPGLPEGQNWTAYGQEVYNNGCNVPVKDAAASGRSLRDVARDAGVEESVLDEALDYRRMAKPHNA